MLGRRGGKSILAHKGWKTFVATLTPPNFRSELFSGDLFEVQSPGYSWRYVLVVQFACHEIAHGSQRHTYVAMSLGMEGKLESTHSASEGGHRGHATPARGPTECLLDPGEPGFPTGRELTE